MRRRQHRARHLSSADRWAHLSDQARTGGGHGVADEKSASARLGANSLSSLSKAVEHARDQWPVGAAALPPWQLVTWYRSATAPMCYVCGNGRGAVYEHGGPAPSGWRAGDLGWLRNNPTNRRKRSGWRPRSKKIALGLSECPSFDEMHFPSY